MRNERAVGGKVALLGLLLVVAAIVFIVLAVTAPAFLLAVILVFAGIGIMVALQNKWGLIVGVLVLAIGVIEFVVVNSAGTLAH